MRAERFRIHVEQQTLDDLQLRLAATRWTQMSTDADWSLGTSVRYLQELVSHWQSGFDWRQREMELNALPHFKANVDGAAIHFVHVRSPRRGAFPLLLLHGWPDSFYRYSKVIPLLAERFDLVVPSLPGFGFTGRVPTPAGAKPIRFSAQLLRRLMTDVLGYPRFAAAGGDGGSALAQALAIDHPEAVVGIHLTDLGWHVSNVDASTLSKSERDYLESSKKRFLADGAYAMVQSTRPRSLAAALNDSPVGLASWIVDRFHSWSDRPDEMERSFTKDELLTNIMVYWVTQTIGASMFSYYAEQRSPSLTPDDHVGRPVGLALFPKDIGGIPPRSLAERTLNVQRWTEMPRGGHFAALEEPEAYARDLVEFFQPMTESIGTPSGASDVHAAI